MLPHDVTAHSTFLGTVALSVTVNNDAGAILRLLTMTRRTNTSFGVRSVSRLDHGIPYLYGLDPGARGCDIRRYGHTNNVLNVLGRLGGNNLVGNTIGHISNGALSRRVGGCSVANTRVSPRTSHVCRSTPNEGFSARVNDRSTR